MWTTYRDRRDGIDMVQGPIDYSTVHVREWDMARLAGTMRYSEPTRGMGTWGPFDSLQSGVNQSSLQQLQAWWLSIHNIDTGAGLIYLQ